MLEVSQSPGPRAAQQRLEALFREHHGAVLAYVRRRAPAESVEDIVAEAFLVAWRRLERVPADQPLPWLLGVARNLIATHRRSAGRRRALGLRLMSSSARAGEQSAESPKALSGEQTGPLAAAFAQLSAKDREALSLIAWEGLGASEAAAVMGLSPGAFRVRLHRARNRLRRALQAPREIGLPAARPRPIQVPSHITQGENK